jgi:hypothetical protein
MRLEANSGGKGEAKTSKVLPAIYHQNKLALNSRLDYIIYNTHFQQVNLPALDRRRISIQSRIDVHELIVHKEETLPFPNITLKKPASSFGFSRVGRKNGAMEPRDEG